MNFLSTLLLAIIVPWYHCVLLNTRFCNISTVYTMFYNLMHLVLLSYINSEYGYSFNWGEVSNNLSSTYIRIF